MTDTGSNPEAWNYLAVCVPIVVFFAPFGSFLSSHFHRQVLASLIYILDTIALVIKSEQQKKQDTFKNWPLAENPYFCPILMKLGEND